MIKWENREKRKNYECKKIKLHINIIKNFYLFKKKKYDFFYKYFFKIEINMKIRVLMFIKNEKIFFTICAERKREHWQAGRFSDGMEGKGGNSGRGDVTGVQRGRSGGTAVMACRR